MVWHLHLDVIAWLTLIQGGYLYALRAVGRPRGLQATRGQLTWYSLGVAVLFLGAGSPIHDLAEQRLFSVHMFQHMLFTLIAPPMLLLGIPGWLLSPLWEKPRALRIGRFLTRPFVAFTSFNLLTLVTHLPVSVDASLNHHWFHFVVHSALVVSALQMWWVIFSPSPELPRLAVPGQMVYLLLQSLVPTVLASFMTLADSSIYHFYSRVPRTWGISVIEDQRMAGLIMKLGGGAVIWVVIGIVFFRWVAREERASRPSSLQWNEVEDELTRMGLTGAGGSPPAR